MGAIHSPSPVLLLLAAFSRYEAALEWGRQQAEAAWGPIALASPAFSFQETDYYEASMGPGIKKCFWAWQQTVDPGRLPKLKLDSNAWEQAYAGLGRHAEPRPLNLDPGYITQAKLVLASTKDHAHRLYLSEGIYAEVTLSYKHRRWQPHEWTFPDYRRDDYQAFFTTCRDYLRSCPAPPAVSTGESQPADESPPGSPDDSREPLS